MSSEWEISGLGNGKLVTGKSENQLTSTPINQSISFTYKCTVPPNTTATLYLPVNKQITEAGKPIKIVKTEGDKILISLGSGSYEFEVR